LSVHGICRNASGSTTSVCYRLNAFEVTRSDTHFRSITPVVDEIDPGSVRGSSEHDASGSGRVRTFGLTWDDPLILWVILTWDDPLILWVIQDRYHRK